MIGKISNLLSRHKWSHLVSKATSLPARELRNVIGDAKIARHHINELIYVGEQRLIKPGLKSNNFFVPINTDWKWRPDPFRFKSSQLMRVGVENDSLLGTGVSIFHDGEAAEVALKQTRNQREIDLAPFSLQVETLKFSGSYISLAIGLPKEALEGLYKNYLIRYNHLFRSEKPVGFSVRLNIVHGPNKEQLVHHFQSGEEETAVEFDLASIGLNEKREIQMWIDVIATNVEMNLMEFKDITLSRCPRAEV